MSRKRYLKKDETLETLIDLDGEIFSMENGYWTKFEVTRVTHSQYIPHGIKYSLTLHDRNNTRVLGFDNAHAVRKKGRRRKKYTGRIITWDHVHKVRKVAPYEFESASQLLDDFWKAVEKIIL